MTLRPLDPVVLDADLADWVEATAAKAGLTPAAYLADLIKADRHGDVVERAHRLAAATHQQWVAAGRPVDDGLTLDEVFGP
ncbi:hypothetical protein ACFVZ3_08205 [Kitasatospora purpeofusca]|uniref:hypothetical protein n=1 Tax=Kitasatospora purpeofusca TaxID=67352 RepID=UPI0036BB4C66